MKASQCKDTSHQSTGHADDRTAFGGKKSTWTRQKAIGGKPP